MHTNLTAEEVRSECSGSGRGMYWDMLRVYKGIQEYTEGIQGTQGYTEGVCVCIWNFSGHKLY